MTKKFSPLDLERFKIDSYYQKLEIKKNAGKQTFKEMIEASDRSTKEIIHPELKEGNIILRKCEEMKDAFKKDNPVAFIELRDYRYSDALSQLIWVETDDPIKLLADWMDYLKANDNFKVVVWRNNFKNAYEKFMDSTRFRWGKISPATMLRIPPPPQMSEEEREEYKKKLLSSDQFTKEEWEEREKNHKKDCEAVHKLCQERGLC